MLSGVGFRLKDVSKKEHTVTREGISHPPAIFRDVYRRLRKAVAGVRFVRSAYYLAIELREAFLDSPTCNLAQVTEDFAAGRDAWDYESSPKEQERFCRQAEMLDSASLGGRRVLLRFPAAPEFVLALLSGARRGSGGFLWYDGRGSTSQRLRRTSSS